MISIYLHVGVSEKKILYEVRIAASSQDITTYKGKEIYHFGNTLTDYVVDQLATAPFAENDSELEIIINSFLLADSRPKAQLFRETLNKQVTATFSKLLTDKYQIKKLSINGLQIELPSIVFAELEKFVYVGYGNKTNNLPQSSSVNWGLNQSSFHGLGQGLFSNFNAETGAAALPHENKLMDYFENLIAMLPKAKSLKSLTLADCSITNNIVHKLMLAVRLLPLQELKLPDNDIRNAGVAIVAKNLPSTIETLDLSNNCFNNRGVLALLAASKTHFLLHKISLGNYQDRFIITDEMRVPLQHYCFRNQFLRRLTQDASLVETGCLVHQLNKIFIENDFTALSSDLQHQYGPQDILPMSCVLIFSSICNSKGKNSALNTILMESIFVTPASGSFFDIAEKNQRYQLLLVLSNGVAAGDGASAFQRSAIQSLLGLTGISHCEEVIPSKKVIYLQQLKLYWQSLSAESRLEEFNLFMQDKIIYEQIALQCVSEQPLQFKNTITVMDFFAITQASYQTLVDDLMLWMNAKITFWLFRQFHAAAPDLQDTNVPFVDLNNPLFVLWGDYLSKNNQLENVLELLAEYLTVGEKELLLKYDKLMYPMQSQSIVGDNQDEQLEQAFNDRAIVLLSTG